ncbi:MAG: alkaline phosphatase family protein [Candidatus Omnitrophica bacterium]|nr:alkaline phosphatase family protein [Candidatus Omnitrophota bacterium]
MSKVIIIGLDGATWGLMKPAVDRGELPTIKRLMDNGVWADFQSTIPAWTIPAWNSLSAGIEPGKLGFSTLMVKIGYDFKPFFYKRSLPKNNLWDILSDNGKKICIANVPHVYSAYEINGQMVAGWYSCGKNLTYPPELEKNLNNVCSGYKIDVTEIDFDKDMLIEVYSRDKLRVKVKDVLLKHSQAFNFLLKSQEWDFAFFVFTALDRIQHRFWDDQEAILDMYRELDQKVKELLELKGADADVFVVSDHGFGTGERTFNINQWLLKNGYLTLKKKLGYKELVLYLQRYIEKLKLRNVARKIIGILPRPMQIKLRKEVRVPRVEALNIDWKRTKAFAHTAAGEIWLNVKGREPAGAINPEEYESTQDAIISKLKELTDPKTGKRIPISVFKKQEIYNSREPNVLPDLVIRLDDNINTIIPSLISKAVIDYKEDYGSHRPNGIFIACGPNIRPSGQRLDDVKIYDVFPTVLHIFGLPVPENADGKVLKHIFRDNSPPAIRPVGYRKIIEREKVEDAVRRLRQSGKI